MRVQNIISNETRASTRRLRQAVPPGSSVYTTSRGASKAGRRVDLYTIKDNRWLYLTYNVATLLGLNLHKGRRGIDAEECAADLVTDLAVELYCDPDALVHRGF